MTEATPSFTTLELRSAYGPVYRQVSTAPPRECTPDEIPIIDMSGAFGDFQARSSLASEIKAASQSIGFFYIKNHGISTEIIEKAHEQAIKSVIVTPEINLVCLLLTNKCFKVLQTRSQRKGTRFEEKIPVLQRLLCI